MSGEYVREVGMSNARGWAVQGVGMSKGWVYPGGGWVCLGVGGYVLGVCPAVGYPPLPH